MSHTIEQIKAALKRGATVFDEYENKVIQVFQYEGDWMHVYLDTRGFHVALVDGYSDKWRIEEPLTISTPPPHSEELDVSKMIIKFRADGTPIGPYDPFEADGFVIDCHTERYAKACCEELKEIDVWQGTGGKNREVIHVCLSPVKQKKTVSYDFFTDRDKWLSHAQAIKERGEAQSKYPEIGTTMYHPQWHDGQMTVDHFTYNGLVEHRAAIDQGYAFTDKDKALALSESFRAITDGAKVVKDVIALKTAAVCNHKAKDIHNIDWEATFNNLQV